jgi:hypothetical protein
LSPKKFLLKIAIFPQENPRNSNIFERILQTHPQPKNTFLHNSQTASTLNPEEAKRRRLAYQQQIREESEKRLQNMTEIRRQNRHVSARLYYELCFIRLL